MSFIDNIVIPFRRRDKRDLSLSRITTGPVNLDSNYSLKVLLLNQGFKRKKKVKSQFAQNLLNEILPEIPSKPKQSHLIQSPPHKRSYSSTKIPSIQQHQQFLEEIAEHDSSKKVIKRYEKNCNIKKHQTSNKLISSFLTPVNSFISSEFCLNMDDYKLLTTQIKNRRHRPPRIPSSTNKKFYMLDNAKKILHFS